MQESGRPQCSLKTWGADPTADGVGDSGPALLHPDALRRHPQLGTRPGPTWLPALASRGPAENRAAARAWGARRPAAHLRESKAAGTTNAHGRRQPHAVQRPSLLCRVNGEGPTPALPPALSPRHLHSGQGGQAWADGGLGGSPGLSRVPLPDLDGNRLLGRA